MTHLPMPSIPVSWGELLDKITILEIKRDHIARPQAAANVAHELHLLGRIAEPAFAGQPVGALVGEAFAELKTINAELWVIEDAIRAEEAKGAFGDIFLQLARSVYRKNDQRAAIKRRINDLLGSELVEEKSYADWQAAAVAGAVSASAR